MPKQPETVTLYPTAAAYIPGVPAVVTYATPNEAAELLAYFPPAFTIEPPDVSRGTPPAAPAEASEA